MFKWFFILQCSLFSTYSIYGQENINSIYFKTLQPDNNSVIEKFPDTLIGCYYKNNDSLIQLCITEDSIYTTYTIIVPVSKNEIKGNNYSTKFDSLLFGMHKNKGLPYKIINDTLYVFLKQTDLFFEINDNNHIKYNNNLLFLNELTPYNNYIVLLLSKTKQHLYLYECDPLVSPIDQVNVNKKTINGQDSYIANPNLEQLENFINKHGFSDTLIFHL